MQAFTAPLDALAGNRERAAAGFDAALAILDRERAVLLAEGVRLRRSALLSG